MAENKNKASDLRTWSDSQLADRVRLLAKETMNLRFQKTSGQLENTARFREIRRETARIHTVRRARAIETERG